MRKIALACAIAAPVGAVLIGMVLTGAQLNSRDQVQPPLFAVARNGSDVKMDPPAARSAVKGRVALTPTPVLPHGASFEAADFRDAVYGNPYKAALDSSSLPAHRRDTVLLYVRDRCREVLWASLDRTELNRTRVTAADAAGQVSEALLALETQCLPARQDSALREQMRLAAERFLAPKSANPAPKAGRKELDVMPLDAWAGKLYVDMNQHKAGGDPKYFDGNLWAGLDGPELYNRAVKQALINITINPDASKPHMESLIHCVNTGNCGVSASLIAVHDLPPDVRTKVLTVAQAIQRAVVAGNALSFEPPQ